MSYYVRVEVLVLYNTRAHCYTLDRNHEVVSICLAEFFTAHLLWLAHLMNADETHRYAG